MIQRIAARHPRGWDQIVAQLNALSSREEFLRGMLDVQCNIVEAEYGAIWIVNDDKQIQPAHVWPAKIAQSDDNAVLKLLADAARGGFEKGVSHVLKIETDGRTEDLNAHVFVTPLRSNDRVLGVVTVVAQCHDMQMVQQTAPLRELAAGLFAGFEARRSAAEEHEKAQRTTRAMSMLAVCQEAKGFYGSALNLVNELARQYQCTRVTLGWVRGKGVRLVAMSDTEDLKRHSEQVAAIELAQAECLDQQQPVLFPVPENAEPLLAHAVVHAHRRVTGGHTNRSALTIPLRDRDEWVGAITLERTDDTFSPELVQQLQLVADIVAPHLHDRKQTDRWIGSQIWHAVEKGAGYLVGPKHVAWKMAAVTLLAIITYACFAQWDYKISGDFKLQSESRRLIPAPYQGSLYKVNVEPGERVKAGQALAQFDSTEQQLRLIEEQSQLAMTRLEKSQATAEGKIAEAQQADANLKRIEARINLLKYQIEHATLRAPIDGYVLSGYWKDKVGGVIELGKVMFEVAPLDDLMVIVQVGEEDVDHIQSFIKHNNTQPTGWLATRSQPEERFQITMQQIVPLAAPVDGKNVFEVRCKLEEPAPWLRPGMAGLARLNVGEERLIWIATHRVVDTIRLWLWW